MTDERDEHYNQGYKDGLADSQVEAYKAKLAAAQQRADRAEAQAGRLRERLEAYLYNGRGDLIQWLTKEAHAEVLAASPAPGPVAEEREAVAEALIQWAANPFHIFNFGECICCERDIYGDDGKPCGEHAPDCLYVRAFVLVNGREPKS